mmetsp:Transcript_7785/g.15444  ORF Transcript_7785/g.15444 Transcript_7785/m.15444 type:complete len:183 (-) Transcript_7785:67-615(-)
MSQQKVTVEPQAVFVPNQVTKVRIPDGLGPGDSFIHTPVNGGRSITIVVPDFAKGGSFVEIIVPDECDVKKQGDGSSSSSGGDIKISKAAAGAALVGGLVGAMVLGPVGAVALAGGAAYATTRKTGKVGSTARSVGESAYSGAEKATKWVAKEASVQINKASDASNNKQAGAAKERQAIRQI